MVQPDPNLRHTSGSFVGRMSHVRRASFTVQRNGLAGVRRPAISQHARRTARSNDALCAAMKSMSLISPCKSVQTFPNAGL